jgi:hypothetical protein
MKRIFTGCTIIALLLLSQTTEAKIWRINNNPGVIADFNSGSTAIASSSVVNGDTLHFEGSDLAYAGFQLSKRLVIIGPGYFLTGANSNPGLQANSASAFFSGGTILFDSTGSGSSLIGLDNFSFSLGPALGSATDNITLSRCRIANIGLYYGPTTDTKMTGWRINKSYIANISFGTNGVVQYWEITNNIFTGPLSLDNPNNLNNLVRNNVFRSSIGLISGYFANNIFHGGISFSVINMTVKNNICIGAAPAGFTAYPGTNGNMHNQLDTDVFEGLTGNSTDGQWRLKAGSVAIGAGETIGGVTPDCGAYGTADPYRLSGIPPIPTIYYLSVPPTVSSSATSMPITISTKSNN